MATIGAPVSAPSFGEARQPPRILAVEGERRADEDMAGKAAGEIPGDFGETLRRRIAAAARG